jgi:hypothetical protein
MSYVEFLQHRGVLNAERKVARWPNHKPHPLTKEWCMNMAKLEELADLDFLVRIVRRAKNNNRNANDDVVPAGTWDRLLTTIERIASQRAEPSKINPVQTNYHKWRYYDGMKHKQCTVCDECRPADWPDEGCKGDKLQRAEPQAVPEGSALDIALNELERVTEKWCRIETAARELIESRITNFSARNGKKVGIQDENGEKCWIVPDERMNALEGAIEANKECDAAPQPPSEEKP